jgi:F-box/leucine-rich repeat protein 9
VRLCELSLSTCRQLTDAALQALAHGCIGLTKLDLTGNYKLTDDGVRALIARCPRLRALHLNGCYNVSKETRAACESLAPPEVRDVADRNVHYDG